MSTTMNTTYKIAIGADHAGVDLKETVAELLKAWGHEVTDMGTMTKIPVIIPTTPMQSQAALLTAPTTAASLSAGPASA